MNLASQTVLEGLNACLDHRGEVYIAELDQVFKRHPDFKLFAAQNPHHQGGGRKGLPSSFVNRFIVVYSDVFTKEDLLHVTAKKFDKIGSQTQHQLIEFMSRLDDAVVSHRLFGAQGSPWEFNLRDTLRWGDLLTSQHSLLSDRKPDDFLDVVIRQRFRTDRDRQEVNKLFAEIFGRTPEDHGLYHDINPDFSQVGLATLQRNKLAQRTPFPRIDPIPRLKEIESVMIAVEQDLPCILVGPSGSGKSALLNHVAALAGKSLIIFPLNADVDAMDLIGGFEQADPMREVEACLARLRIVLQENILRAVPQPVPEAALNLMGALHSLTGEAQYENILTLVDVLQANGSMAEDLSAALSETSDLLHKPLTMDNPRFEWLDGVIVRAVESGAWLVLDNANLCSASVLDRLNSLLERPNGSLSINEHSGPGGEPRVIALHPDFRIFLTVDPRYGELSRAMRNRSIEIYLDGSVVPRAVSVDRIAPVDGSLHRYHAATSMLNELSAEDELLAPLAFDLLSLGDTKLLQSFVEASQQGADSLSALATLQMPAANQRLAQLSTYITSDDAGILRQAVAQLYGAAQDRMLMPLHPLLNAPMIQPLEKAHEGLAFWLATCYELYLETQTFQTTVEAQLRKVNISKPSLMNRLQRSSVADKVASLSKDSTANSVRFLASAMRAFKTYITENTNEAGSWKLRRSVLRRLMLFWRRTFESLVASSFEEARFQAHLTQGSNLLQHGLSALQETGGHKVLSSIAEYLERDFVVGFKLTTGLSMELLWTQMRPDPIPDPETLRQVVELERLADRFDSLCWRANINVSTLRTVQDSMAKAYAVVRTGKGDASALVEALQAEISALEAGMEQHTTEHRPFFSASFEGLRQARILHRAAYNADAGSASLDEDVLADIPTIGLMRLQSLKPTALQAVDYMLVQNSDVRPWSGVLSKSLLLKYDAASSANLHELRSLEVEMPIMGKALAQATGALGTSAVVKTEVLLLQLMDQVMRAHGDSYADCVGALYQDILAKADFSAANISDVASCLKQGNALKIQGPAHLVAVFETHFSKALVSLAAANKNLQPRSAYASIAWVQFALGCVKLFVPDKIYDPHHRAQVEAEEHREMSETLQRQITALEAFELAFTGQRDSVRSKLLEEEVQGLGPPPAVQSIYRPGDIELRGLQGEFMNVLNSLVKSDVSSSHLRSVSAASAEVGDELALIEQNVVLLIGRLMGRFEAYHDLTMPLVSFLRCLQMGLSIGRGAVQAEDGDMSQSLVAVTPFLSGTVWRAEATGLPLCSLEFLSFVQAVVAVEGLDNIPGYLRRGLHESFAAFHAEWTRKLEADRKVEQERTSLFRHKGTLEDEEEFDQEEFEQLFPDYYPAEGDEDDKPKQKKIKKGGRDLSVMLAEAHERIFLAPLEAQQSIRGLCTQVARRVAREKRQDTACDPALDGMLLPATLMVFDEQLKAFGSSVEGTNYNFYTDSNLVEVRKLLNLVNGLKKRFLELQGIDEIGHHQTLTDVIGACDKVLELAIDDPLASLLPSVEKLHSFLYEWHEGGWATKANKATALYDQLQDSICDWRRLELSSWARLLDTELKKCHDDAKSWWFIAYGAVVLEPCSILAQGLDLKDHAIKLLGILQAYFAGANVGQFASRLALLKQLKNQLDLLVVDEAPLALIRDATQNFIVYVSRYENKVAESIRLGRIPLDRKMKDVLLMFKWRDKNIESLRDSARKSHQKLFKLVRKFRTVLEQPVRVIVEQGLPDEEHGREEGLQDGIAVISVDRDAVVRCQELVPGIQELPEWSRMANLGGVVKAMSKHGSLPTAAIDAGDTLDDFITDLVSTMTELRKETPGTLTDENKEAVRHLKTRKTTLYADTLKTLRTMGFSRNIGTIALGRQSSTEMVLVGSGLVPVLSASSLDAIEYFYHKTIDLASRFRHGAVECHEDLNRDTIHRSIGYLEGILLVMFRQRQFLSRAATAGGELEKAIAFFKEITATEVETEKGSTNYAQAISWVIQILKFAAHLVEVHGKLGGANNESVRAGLNKWVDAFAALDIVQQNLPHLPDGFGSSGQTKLQADVERELEDLRADLSVLLTERPDLAFVTRQIQLWTSTHTVSAVNGVHDAAEQPSAIQEFTTSTLTLTSKILVALQNFQKTAQTLPTTNDDAGWLLKYNVTLEKSVDALRTPLLAADITQLLTSLHRLPLDQPAVRVPATSLLCAVLPVLQQYAAASQHHLAQFGALHRATCRLGFTLSNTFVTLAAQGFCSPQEKSNETSNESGKVETGTGLGDGDGAEDISKDVQPDEDLEDLAQDPGNRNQDKDDIEDNKDAVDMGEDELEGQMGSVAGDSDEEEGGDDESGDEDDDEQEEEAGDVDDLDPTAVDEKMWDGSGEDDADKDQKGDDAAGKKDDDEQTAGAEDDKKKEKEKREKEEQRPDEESKEKGEEDPEAEGDPGQELEEALPQEELNNQDQNVEENDTLALPEEMNLDLDDESVEGEDDDFDDLEKMEEDKIEEGDIGEESGEEDEETTTEPQKDEVGGKEDEIEEDANAPGKEEEMDVDADEEKKEEEQGEEDKKTEQPQMRDDGQSADQENAADSDVQNGGGQAQDDADNMQEEADNKTAQRDQGAVGKQAAEQENAAPGEKGTAARADQEQGPTDDADAADATDAQPFKKLGDALERWHKSQRDIRNAPDGEDNSNAPDADMAKAEFQHLQDENAEADTQALGAATDEETRPMDDAMAIDNDMEDDGRNPMLDDAVAEEDTKQDDVDMEDMDLTDPQDSANKDREDGRSGVATRQGAMDDGEDAKPRTEADADEEDEQIQETSTQLSATHLTDGDAGLRDYSEALEMWSTFQAKTHSLSLSLSSQLRLILTPSQSTKLSGAFRTGKRLNIKKIIPYIASSYKRDKIWMRRSIPSKRAYQILLCVDDSRSMDEAGSSSGRLALESLVMVSRALTMLEVGQVGVVGFGTDVFVAHDLTAPLFASHDAGARVLQRFTFRQDGTDMVRLLRRTLDQLRDARLLAHGGGEDLWQLALVLSDGLVQSKDHARLRPLLREAMEQRVMVVFIVMDDASGGGGKKGHSVLELKEARFGADGMPVIHRYLDSFPFPYYLIVHHLEDLPGALAALLRTWFSEVAV